MSKKTTIRLENAGRRADITVELRTVTEARRTTALQPVEQYVELSISARLWEGLRDVGGGQCQQTVMEWFGGEPDEQRYAALTKLLEIWDRWHLNGMRAGTARQNEALKDCEHTDYVKRCEHLEARGLLVDDSALTDEDRAELQSRAGGTSYSIGKDYRNKVYKYGTAWLVEEIPESVIYELAGSCRLLGGNLDAPPVTPLSPMAELCIDRKITIEAKFVGTERASTHDGNWQRRHFVVALRRPGAEITGVDFYQGMAFTSDPTVADVLTCLVAEVEAGEMDFEEYCSTYGEDTDSRKAHEAWKACAARAPQVREFLGEDFEQFVGAEN